MYHNTLNTINVHVLLTRLLFVKTFVNSIMLEVSVIQSYVCHLVTVTMWKSLFKLKVFNKSKTLCYFYFMKYKIVNSLLILTIVIQYTTDKNNIEILYVYRIVS